MTYGCVPSSTSPAVPRSTLRQTAAPTEEPLTLDEAKLHLRVDHPDDNDLITRLIVSARQLSEEFCRRAWCTQTWRLSLDEFPTAQGGLVLLERSPVAAISGIAYVDSNGVTQALTGAQLDAESAPARVLPAYGTTWPATRAVMNAVQITFTCGYGAATAVPAVAKTAMLQAIGHWYENRESVTTGTIATELPGLAEQLLVAADLRVFRFG